MDTKPILKTTVGLQSVALMGRAVQMVPTKWTSRRKPKKKQSKKMIKGFTDIIVGTSLLKPTATLVETF